MPVIFPLCHPVTGGGNMPVPVQFMPLHVNPVKPGLDCLIQLALVGLYTNHVVHLLLSQFFHNFVLAGDSVYGHDALLEVEDLYQFGDGLYLVAFVVYFFLAKAHAVGCGPRADHT